MAGFGNKAAEGQLPAWERVEFHDQHVTELRVLDEKDAIPQWNQAENRGPPIKSSTTGTPATLTDEAAIEIIRELGKFDILEKFKISG